MTDLSTSTPTAGWYPDPADSGGERWWTGVGWTADVRARPAVMTPPPMVQPVPAPAAPQSPTPSASLVGAVAAPLVDPQPWRPYEGDVPYRPIAPAAPGDGRPAWRRDPQPNTAATRAVIAAAVVVAFVGGRLVFDIPGGVPLIAVGISIVFGIIGAVLAKEKLAGLKRSVAAIVVGGLGLVVTAGTLVSIFSYDFAAELERSIVSTLAAQNPPVAVTSATCPQMDMPPVGSTLDCAVTFADTQVRLVTVTILDASGSYSLQLATS